MGDDKILDGVFHKLAVLCKPLSETSKRCDEGNQSRTVAKKVSISMLLIFCVTACVTCVLPLLWKYVVNVSIIHVHFVRVLFVQVQLLSVDETELLEQRIQNAIAVSTCPTLKRFQFYMTDKSPVVLERCIDHWPALFKWR